MQVSNLVVMLQLLFSFIVALYFWNMIKGQRSNKNYFEMEAKRELIKLKKLREVSLTVPLTEKARPASFEDIIGQEDGIKALKAALCGPNPQHVIIYGPPGIGKTAASRLVLDYAKKVSGSPFTENAKFVEIDATTARFDERGIADPLIGSVHDPIYQGAGAYGNAGIPQPKRGAVTNAHGGILFIDEIGELHPIQTNKLLKVLEDRKVILESAYYSEENSSIPQHIHDIFKNGLPADFRLVGATTRQPHEISPAIRSRCVEIFFKDLELDELKSIAKGAVKRMNIQADDSVLEYISSYSHNGRDVINLVQLASGAVLEENRDNILISDVEWVIHNGQLSPRINRRIHDEPRVGIVNGLGVFGPNSGSLLEIEIIATKTIEKGSITVNGIIEEETIGSQAKQVRRKSMARGSVENVLTYLKTSGAIDGNYNIHVNFPGGVPIDGPSAGIAMAVGIFSAVHKVTVPNDIAFTGEVGIYGNVKPIGGVVTKANAALKAGVKTLIIPSENYTTMLERYNELNIVRVNNMTEVLEITFKLKENSRLNLISENDNIINSNIG
ncbi:MAG: Lon protease [Bacillales bacterium]|nr:Lon protease [Bacillales bacterium]